MLTSARLTHLLQCVLLFRIEGTVELEISSPKHGAEFDKTAIRINGGIDVDVSVLAGTRKDYMHDAFGLSVCLHVNGSAFAGALDCVADGSAHGLVMRSTTWQAGRAWLYIEL